MKFIFLLGLKNLSRRRRRTFFTAIGVVLGVCLTLVYLGVSNYTYGSLIDNSAKMNYGHISFVNEDYLLRPNAQNGVKISSKEEQSSSLIPGVQKALSRIIISGMAVSARKSVPVGLMGIDVLKETGEDNAFLNHIQEGELPNQTVTVRLS